jgi:hypothetical protein
MYIKSMKDTIKFATISGIGRFPMDMLRYDQCWPRHTEDARVILETVSEEMRSKRWTVQVVSKVRAFTIARWNSFGVFIAVDENV